jgi:hypothetical protein
MKKILLTTLLTLGLSTAAIAENPATEGTYIAPDSSTLDFSSDYDFAIGGALDYGVGVTMQFKKMIDVSIGHAGLGADFIFFRYQFMKNSKFFSKRPMNFYVGGGLGYIWEDGGTDYNPNGTPGTTWTNDDAWFGLNQGLVLRTPIGADWTFANNWSAYLSASIALNFKQEQTTNGVVTRESNVDFLIMPTVGVRYLF